MPAIGHHHKARPNDGLAAEHLGGVEDSLGHKSGIAVSEPGHEAARPGEGRESGDVAGADDPDCTTGVVDNGQRARVAAKEGPPGLVHHQLLRDEAR